jgi:hypothetical protein
MTNAEIKKVIMGMYETAKENLIRDKELAMVGFSLTQKKEVVVAILDNTNGMTKGLAVRQLQAFNRAHKAEASWIIADARMASVANDSELAKRMEREGIADGEISANPDYQEVLVMNVQQRNGKRWMVMTPYGRVSGHIVFGEPNVMDSDDAEIKGRMVDLL